MLHDFETEEYLLKKLDEYKAMRQEGTICSHCIDISVIETYRKLKLLGVEPYKSMSFLDEFMSKVVL